MNKNLAYIYTLIILESRLSLKDAEILFGISQEDINELFWSCLLNHQLEHALKYLFYKESMDPGIANPKKSRFKASLLYKKYLNIMKIKNKEERKTKLNDFIRDLKGDRIKELINKNASSFTAEEKDFILKYYIKFGFVGNKFAEIYNIDRSNISRWTKQTNNQDIKKQMECLNDYNYSMFCVNVLKR